MNKNFSIILIALLILLIPLTAQSEGIPLQRDILLSTPIFGPEDLPEEIAFNLYDSKTSTLPLGFQTFKRGHYTVDFEFSKSDGITGGNVARLSANFTNTLHLKDAEGESLQPKEIWVALEVAGAEVGDRSKVSDETLVQLILASDASIATYLTLVYQGEDNPISTIYRDLPISSVSSDGSGSSLENYFSAVAANDISTIAAGTRATNWVNSGTDVIMNTGGEVGVGTNNPLRSIHMHKTTDIAAYALFTNVTTGLGYHNGVSVGLSGAEDGVIWLYESTNLRFATADAERMRIDASGNVGIGTINPGTYKLAVNGKIRAKEIVVDTGWSDFVFEENYQLPSLSEVEAYIGQHKHLPGVPSEAQVKANGVTLGKISSKLLQKIEELTLYVIDLKKENEALKGKLSSIERKLNQDHIN